MMESIEKTPNCEVDERYNKISSPPEYEILSISSLSTLVNNRLNELSNIFELSPSIMRVILNRYNWDEAVAVTNLTCNRRKVFTEIKLEDPDKKILFNARRFVKNFKSVIQNEGNRCKKCASEVNKRTYMKCKRNHKYCFTCWNQHVREKVLLDKESYTITCPSSHCKLLIDYDEVVQNVLLLQVCEEYQRLNLIKFVANNNLYNWCPNESCKKIIKVKNVKIKEVACFCGYKFCFCCLENWHNPINCKMLQEWLMKIKTTKNDFNICPNCDTIMESFENNNPSQTNCSSCNIFYCTQCSGPNEINQNLYSENGNYLLLDDANNIKTVLLYRYQFYFKKYNKHKEILDAKRELETYIEMELNFISKKVANSSSVVKLVEKIVDSIFECRETLMNTYIFSYYLSPTDVNSKIFFHNQNKLESTIEKVCKNLETIYHNNFSDDTLKSLEKQLNCCCKFEKLLCSTVTEGYEKKIWKFAE